MALRGALGLLLLPRLTRFKAAKAGKGGRGGGGRGGGALVTLTLLLNVCQKCGEDGRGGGVGGGGVGTLLGRSCISIDCFILKIPIRKWTHIKLATRESFYRGLVSRSLDDFQHSSPSPSTFRAGPARQDGQRPSSSFTRHCRRLIVATGWRWCRWSRIGNSRRTNGSFSIQEANVPDGFVYHGRRRRFGH